MFQRLLFSLATVSLVTLIANAQTTSLANHPIVTSNLMMLDAWLSANAACQQQPGCAVAIVYDQTVVYAKAFGFADVERKAPFTTDTIVRIGSQSKQFTAIAIMQLCEAGKISLDDPIKKYLPNLQVKTRPLPDFPITVENLLTHTAGLRSDGTLTHHWTELDFTTNEQLDAEISSLNIVYGPSRKRKYSNLGYAIAGRIVEEVSGLSFDDYVQSRILIPLKMNSTYTRAIPRSAAIRIATGYGRRMPNGNRDKISEWDARSMTPAFGMSSTLNDLITFVRWQMRVVDASSVDVLAPHTIREMRRAHWTDDDWSGGWGLGFQVSRLTNCTVYGLYGSVPGFFSSTYIDADQELGVIVLTNSMDAQPYLGQPLSIPERAFAIMGPAIERAKKGESVPNADGTWSRYYGKYRSIWSDWVVLNYEGSLAFFDPTASDPLASLFKLQPLEKDKHRFLVESGPDPQIVDEELRFDFEQGDESASGIDLIGLGRSGRVR